MLPSAPGLVASEESVAPTIAGAPVVCHNGDTSTWRACPRVLSLLTHSRICPAT